MENPVYVKDDFASRPRGLTAINRSIVNMKNYMCMFSILGACTALVTMGLVILGNEMTKEMWVADNGLVVSSVPVATHQAVQLYDFDDLLDTETLVDSLNDMRYVMVETPHWTSKHMVESWRASNYADYFQVNTTDGYSLTFNGTHLSWGEEAITEVMEPEPEATRGLFGWKDKLAKKVKKKLDSPMCNTEALVDKIGRKLDLLTAPACHVGVSGAKIYMHYRDS